MSWVKGQEVNFLVFSLVDMSLGLFGTCKIMQLDFVFQTIVCMRLGRWG